MTDGRSGGTGWRRWAMVSLAWAVGAWAHGSQGTPTAVFATRLPRVSTAEGEEEQCGEPEHPPEAGQGARAQSSGREPPEGAPKWVGFCVGDGRRPGCRSPSHHRIASQGQGELRRVRAAAGREELAGLEEAETLEHLLGSAVARHHGQDSSAAAAGAAPDVLAEGAGLKGGPRRGGVALALAPPQREECSTPASRRPLAGLAPPKDGALSWARRRRGRW
jgi:hypothetical protein